MCKSNAAGSLRDEHWELLAGQHRALLGVQLAKTPKINNKINK